MQYPVIYDTSKRPDYTRGGIKEKGCDRPPVDSPISKSAILLEIFQKTIGQLAAPFPPSELFPLMVVDWRMALRMKEILAIPDPRTPWGKGPYCVQGKGVCQWLKELEGLIGIHSILEEYIVGSAATYIAGQPLLREALDVLLQHVPNHIPEKQTLRIKIPGKIAQKTFPFADVDLRIKLHDGYNLWQLQQHIRNIYGFNTDLFGNKTLIVYINDDQGNALDIVIYTDLDNESAFNLDDFKVNIFKSDLQNNFVAFESSRPWKMWLGHTLGELVNDSTDAFRIVPRLLWQLSKGKVSVIPTDSVLFPQWLEKMQGKLLHQKLALKEQFDKQQSNHDRHIPMVDCLLRLRAQQQLIKDRSPSSIQMLKRLAETEVDNSAPPFIKTLFYAMNEKGADIHAIHSLIESIALLALYEAWQKPFEVKLIKHEGNWLMRLRFRGKYTRNFLVRFDFSASMNILKKATVEQWQKMRVVVHSLWFDPINQRTLGSNYKKTLTDKNIFQTPVTSKMIDEIKSLLLRDTCFQKKEVILAEQPPLAQLEIDWSQEPKFLLEIGKIVFYHYHFDLGMRYKLCWKVVNKCILMNGYFEAAEMVNLLRNDHEDPVEGYAALFANVIQKGGNSYLYQACSPLPPMADEKWFKLSESKNKPKDVVDIMNGSDISAELFLEMTRLLKLKNFEVSEAILCKILEYDKKRACEWIKKKDKSIFVSQNYNRLVSEHIVASKAFFDPTWIKDYILSKRFRGENDASVALCKYLLTKPLEATDKAAVLQTLEIKDMTLWQQVANEFIGQGESWPDCYNKEANIDSATLVLWHQIIEHADDKTFVEETLKKIPLPQDGVRDIIRSHVLVRLLKNWEKRKVDLEVIKKLDLSKKLTPWDVVLHEAESGEQILKALFKVSLPLYSALFRTIKPKDPFYTTYWIKMLDIAFKEGKNKELLAALDTPMMTDCLQIHPESCLPIYKRVATFEEGIVFTLDNLPKADQDLFCTMIHTCVALEDGGSTGAKAFMKYFDATIYPKKSKELVNDLSSLAKKILMNPQGDIEAACNIWKVIKNMANPDQLPPQKNLHRIIQLGYSDWVNEMLNKAQQQELESLDPTVYCSLLSKVEDLDKRCHILEGCHVFSESIQKHWEIVAKSNEINPFSAVRLLNSSRKHRIADAKVHQLALHLLSQNEAKSIPIEEHVLHYLVELISRLDMTRANELWQALERSKRIEQKRLWEAAVDIVSRNLQTPSYKLVSWITNHVNGQSSEKYLTLLTQITAYPLEERILSIVLTAVKKEALKQDEKAIELYWKLDCDENISESDLDLLNPTIERCKKALDRMREKLQGDSFPPHLFASFMHTVLAQRNLNDNEAYDIQFTYRILCNYTQDASEKERCLWLQKIIPVLLCDLVHLDDCNVQATCISLINRPYLMRETQQLILLDHLSTNKLLLPQQWQLIGQIGSDTQEALFKTALKALANIVDVDACPARIIFQSYRFPDYLPEVEGILKRVQCPDRKNYLDGILLSSVIIFQWKKIKETEIFSPLFSFMDYLPLIYNYLQQHQKVEIKEWWSLFGVDSGDSVPVLFFGFLMNFIHQSHHIIFSNEKVFKKFLDAIDIIGKTPSLRISLITLIIKESLEHITPETEQLCGEFISTRMSAFDQSQIEIGKIKEGPFNELIRSAALLAIKRFPYSVPFIKFCANMCKKYMDLCKGTNKDIKIELISIHMMLTGQIYLFPDTLVMDGSHALHDAIQTLLAHPHPANIKKVRTLLNYGTRTGTLYLYPARLVLANQRYVKILLERGQDDVQILIPELFAHTYDELDMTKGKKNKSGYSDVNREIFKKARFELIQYNIGELTKAHIDKMDCILGALTVTVINIMQDNYKLEEHPEYIQKVNLLLIDACEKAFMASMATSRLYDESALLLCCHPYIPLEPWQPFFRMGKFEELYEKVQSAREYYKTLVNCKGDINSLLKLAPDSQDPKMKGFGFLMRSQWLLVTYKIILTYPFGDDEWCLISRIQSELLACFVIASENLSETLTNALTRILKPLCGRNGIISRSYPDLANEWLQYLIKSAVKNLTGEAGNVILSRIFEIIQDKMTLELIPSLPCLEDSLKYLGDLHAKRGCVEAYVRLLQLGCTDNTIIAKAVELAPQLYNKITLSSMNSFENKVVVCHLNPNEDFHEHFLFIYLFALDKILKDFIKHNDNNKFCQDLFTFRTHTEGPLKLIEKTDVPFTSSVLKLLHENLALFKESAACDHMMSIVLATLFLKCDETIDINYFAEIGINYIMLLIFADSDTSKLIAEFFQILNPVLSKYAPKIADRDSKLQAFAIKSEFLNASVDPDHKVGKIRALAITNLEFQKLFIKYIDEIIIELKYFKHLRPAYTDWYDSWIVKAYSQITQVLLHKK